MTQPQDRQSGEVHCSALNLHEGVRRRDRPLATYMVMANPCHTKACDGRICKGHPVCPGCAAGMRAGKTSWGKSGDTAEVATLWSIPAAARVRQVGQQQ